MRRKRKSVTMAPSAKAALSTESSTIGRLSPELSGVLGPGIAVAVTTGVAVGRGVGVAVGGVVGVGVGWSTTVSDNDPSLPAVRAGVAVGPVGWLAAYTKIVAPAPTFPGSGTKILNVPSFFAVTCFLLAFWQDTQVPTKTVIC
jgi:hypothetical protein